MIHTTPEGFRTEVLKDGNITHHFTPQEIVYAEQILLTHLRTAPRRPGELEDYFCGVPTLAETLLCPLGRWKESMFYPALGRLVDTKVVVWWQDNTDDVYYGLPSAHTAYKLAVREG